MDRNRVARPARYNAPVLLSILIALLAPMVASSAAPSPGGRADRPGASAESRASSETSPAAPAGDVDPGEPDAQKLLEEVLRRHAACRDFEARFTETAVSRATGEAPAESGTVSYLRPDMWRWEYRTPEKKLVIVRGKTAAIAVAGETEVSKYDLDQDGGASGVSALLAGGEAVARSFSARFVPPAMGGSPLKDGEAMLKLVPVTLSDQYAHVLLRVHRKSRTVLEAIVVDPGGNSLRFRFSDLRPNRGLRPSAFDLPSSGELSSGEP